MDNTNLETKEANRSEETEDANKVTKIKLNNIENATDIDYYGHNSPIHRKNTRSPSLQTNEMLNVPLLSLNLRRHSLPVEARVRIPKPTSNSKIATSNLFYEDTLSPCTNYWNTPLATPCGSVSSLVSSLDGGNSMAHLNIIDDGVVNEKEDIYLRIEEFLKTLEEVQQENVEEFNPELYFIERSKEKYSEAKKE